MIGLAHSAQENGRDRRAIARDQNTRIVERVEGAMPSLRIPLSTLFVRHGLRWFSEVIKVLRRLWLEVTGTVFLAMAIFGVAAAIREWRVMEPGGSLVRFATTIFFIAMMGGFGVYSFLKARKLR